MSGNESIIDEFVPDWLNDEYLLNILKHDEIEGHNIKVNLFIII